MPQFGEQGKSDFRGMVRKKLFNRELTFL